MPSTIAESLLMTGRYSSTTASRTVWATLAGEEETNSLPESSRRLTLSSSLKGRGCTHYVVLPNVHVHLDGLDPPPLLVKQSSTVSSSNPNVSASNRP